uniref:VWFA domain-containing protein n=1 Tax=Heterorhabditis bacteriophora TaxID=37862 RepID=A0A1I7X4N3_HETBA
MNRYPLKLMIPCCASFALIQSYISARQVSGPSVVIRAVVFKKNPINWANIILFRPMLHGRLLCLALWAFVIPWSISQRTSLSSKPASSDDVTGKSSLTFVFDITGSMFDDLVQVREGARKIFQTVMSQREKLIYNYIMVPFHDPREFLVFSNS